MYNRRPTVLSKQFKLGLLMLVLTIGVKVFASDIYIQDGTCTGKEISGAEAVKLLVTNPKVKILKYAQIELSEKTGKIKNKSNR